MTRADGSNEAAMVIVVDDDPGVRAAVVDLLRSVGLEALAFAGTDELFAEPLPDRPGCIVLDVRLPGGNGLDLQDRLRAAGNSTPIIFLSGFGDVPMSVRAMKGGAVDFLTKPVRDQDLLDAVGSAIARDRDQRLIEDERGKAVASIAKLTPREREVVDAVARGLMNKQIAFELGISEITVKLHRGNAMRKLGVRSVPDLVHTLQRLE